MTTIRTSRTLDEYAAAMGLQTLSREIELNSEDVERRLVEVCRQHPEETPEQQYARAVARELWFNYPRLRRNAPAEPQEIQPAAVESFLPMLEKMFEKFTEACDRGLDRKAAQEVQPVTLRLTTWQRFALYLWMVVTLVLLGVIAARGQGGQGPMIEALDEGIRVRFFAAGVMRWNCIGPGIACTWNPVTRRVDLTIVGVLGHNLLSGAHGDTVAAGAVRGDLIVGSAVPDWQRFPRGAANQSLIMNPGGTDPVWAPPVLPCPIQYYLVDSYFTWTNMPLALTELLYGDGFRVRIDLTNANQIRMHVNTQTAGTATAQIWLRYALADAGPYIDLMAQRASLAAGWTRVTTAWEAIPVGARADVYVGIWGAGGDGAADPQVNCVQLQVR